MPSLHIVVCIKPVPDPRKWNKLKLDPETMLLLRGDIPAVVNPLDRQAIEQAVQLKASHGGKVSVLTMAPPDAEDQLAEALAMGCDAAYLLSDPALAGADTLATARCLAAAIRRLGSFDAVFCGGYSLDGSTAQVGPQVAELLDLPDLTHATEIRLEGAVLTATCQTEEGLIQCQADLPVLVTLLPGAEPPRLPSMTGVRRAADSTITRWTAEDLGLSPEEAGLRGSPTQMLNVFTAPVGRKGEMLQGVPDEMARQLLERLRREKALKFD